MSDADHDEVPLAPLRWRAGALEPVDGCENTVSRVAAADSWFVTEGRARGLELHRQRFERALPAELRGDAAPFWDAAIATLPRTGDWFPRVEARTASGRAELRLLMRPAPAIRSAARVVSHHGADPRRSPTIKGPDLETMLRVRSEGQRRGADEVIITSPEGYVVEGAYSAVAWWRGDILAFPADDLERVDSVTARSLETLAVALGVDTVREHTTASELEGHEVWILNALHGIRIVTAWVDGPSVAEQPGRRSLWARRLDALRRPLP
ncbi:aminotransferase class IV [Amnibacterium flavum]|uniref:Aminotransferase class IV n=1 Tax=Amnibacterium flavum TaxID=2173173 RepID=A0A2V1HT03_9MICO|nr:aminotransferase class IV [Amnibacterium flavum]PVZ94090.1 hypothetical protein DDQ50_10085 [Amnibacterium flavum]